MPVLEDAILHGMTSTLTPPRQKPRLGGPGSGTGDAWKVVVLNDEHNTFEHVIATFCQVLPGTSPEQAEKLAWQIHRSGLALVWCGHQELAELYHEQLKAAALTLAPLER